MGLGFRNFKKTFHSSDISHALSRSTLRASSQRSPDLSRIGTIRLLLATAYSRRTLYLLCSFSRCCTQKLPVDAHRRTPPFRRRWTSLRTVASPWVSKSSATLI